MGNRNRAGLIVAALGMLIVILEARTAASGIAEGIELCLKTLIPALFPFLILSGIVTSGLMGREIKTLRWICRLCRIPPGTESLLLVGLLGGYPVGARSVAEAFRRGQLSKETACKMAVFCNNAGPSFLFGILGPLFSGSTAPWILWLIHATSAIICGTLLPGGSESKVPVVMGKQIPLTESVKHAIKTMAQICGWVLLFRMILEFLNRWLFWMLPDPVQVLLSGILELSNGCIRLDAVANENIRFLLASVMLSFGGLCVWMQTQTLCAGLEMKYYLPGKLLQAAVSAILSAVYLALTSAANPEVLYYILPLLIIGYIFFHNCRNRKKKEVAI